MIGIMVVVIILVQVLSIFGSSRSFVSSTFALYIDRELSQLKHKLVVTTLLEEQILRNSVLKVYKDLIDGDVLNMNLISFGMYDFYVILGLYWLSIHRALVLCFSKKVVFRKLRYIELEFEDDRRVFPTCVISPLEAKNYYTRGVRPIWHMWLTSHL